MIILPAPCIIYCMPNGHTAVVIRASAVATQEATDASSVVTQETTPEDSMRNDTVRSMQSLSPSVLQPFERSELRMKTATGYAEVHLTEPLSPFVSREAATTGARPSANGCREDSNWLRGSTFKEIAVAIRKARWLANDWRKARRLANDCRSGGTTGEPQ